MEPKCLDFACKTLRRHAGWPRKAAEQGDVDAQDNLGAMYSNGHGVPQDYAQAIVWFRKAAEQGNAAAQYNLGVMYQDGPGVPQDYVLAHMRLNFAASRAADTATRDQAAKSRHEVAAARSDR